jgi:hypothetical protein
VTGGATLTPTARAALAYVARGWSVFPLRPGGKEPLTKHGLQDATQDAAQVEAWWRRWPDANIGNGCGPSGLLVVDADHGEGQAGWADLCALMGGHPPTLAVRTRRGFHLYFRADKGAPWARSSSGRLAPHVDTRGAGGYVVAPPSVHPSGRRYQWLDEAAPLADAPAWLRELLTPRARPLPADTPRPLVPWAQASGVTPYGGAALARVIDQLRGAAEGTRNDSLNAAAFSLGRLVAGGELDLTLAAAALLEAALAVGLDANESRRTTWSGLTAGLKVPRQAPTR